MPHSFDRHVEVVVQVGAVLIFDAFRPVYPICSHCIWFKYTARTVIMTTFGIGWQGRCAKRDVLPMERTQALTAALQDGNASPAAMYAVYRHKYEADARNSGLEPFKRVGKSWFGRVIVPFVTQTRSPSGPRSTLTTAPWTLASARCYCSW